MAAQIQFNRGMLFENEGAHNGRARWQDLKFRKGQILSKRGTLRKSIAPIRADGSPGPDGIVRIAGDMIYVGTQMLSARLMNDGTTKMPGGVLKPVRAKALKIPVPQGASAGGAAVAIQDAARKKQIAVIRQEMERMTKGQKQYERAEKRIQKIEEKMGKGTGSVKHIFRKSVKIPARPFDDWNDADQVDFDAALLGKLQQVLNGKRA